VAGSREALRRLYRQPRTPGPETGPGASRLDSPGRLQGLCRAGEVDVRRRPVGLARLRLPPRVRRAGVRGDLGGRWSDAGQPGGPGCRAVSSGRRGDAVYPFTAKLGVSNSRSKPQVVAVEPWANDYTLLPGEELEIVAFGDAELPWFHVVEWDGVSQVYC